MLDLEILRSGPQIRPIDSAFFGVGFTTREAELVVNHPVRRRIIRDLILAGNIGLTSSLATLVATMPK
ncbi:MAG: hypothetical protein SGI77_18250 [Pirellulaceae bacterium]|nr:hypothetical protein [Pirellulaceae bacterium]